MSVELGKIAIHGEHAVGDDDHAARAPGPRGLQLRLEIGHVAIGIAEALRLRETDAIDDGGVVEAVGDDGVFLAEQWLEHAAIGIEAGGVEDRILLLDIAGDAGLQRLVQIGGPADEADGGHAEAMGVESLPWRRQ